MTVKDARIGVDKDANGFGRYRPDPAYAREEDGASTQWNGPDLPYIVSQRPWPPMAPLDVTLQRLMKSLWKDFRKATDPNAQRLQLIGASRPGMPEPGYAPLTAPLRSKPLDVQKMVPGADLSKVEHLDGVAKDWGAHKFVRRVTGFSFRGDTRNPDALRVAGGFSPPSSRTDEAYMNRVVIPQFQGYMKRRFNRNVTAEEVRAALNEHLPSDQAKRDFLNFTIWRAMVDQEALHMGRMVADEDLKGYISTSKATSVPKAFAGANGYVYVIFLHGALEVPKKYDSTWTQIYGEQEVAWLGHVPFGAVSGWRQVDNNRMFTGDIRLSPTLVDLEPMAMQQVYVLLSGARQGPRRR